MGSPWKEQDSFYTLNLETLVSVYTGWTESLPHVKPYYAVKCNPTREILEKLARLGSNFDCASPAEIQAVLDLGVSPERIIYANPCKRNEDIVFAKERDIRLSTFDSECELRKISKLHPECKLILRIRADDPNAPALSAINTGRKNVIGTFFCLRLERSALTCLESPSTSGRMHRVQKFLVWPWPRRKKLCDLRNNTDLNQK